jgi:hypothetical protein
MENLDKEKIEQIIKTRKQANAYFNKQSKVFRAFLPNGRTYNCSPFSLLFK